MYGLLDYLLSVCQQDNRKPIGPIFMKLGVRWQGPRKNPLSFGVDPNHPNQFYFTFIEQVGFKSKLIIHRARRWMKEATTKQCIREINIIFCSWFSFTRPYLDIIRILLEIYRDIKWLCLRICTLLKRLFIMDKFPYSFLIKYWIVLHLQPSKKIWIKQSLKIAQTAQNWKHIQLVTRGFVSRQCFLWELPLWSIVVDI